MSEKPTLPSTRDSSSTHAISNPDLHTGRKSVSESPNLHSIELSHANEKPAEEPMRKDTQQPDDWKKWLNESVRTESLVGALVMHSFSAGLLDATTYVDFKTFASNQTGNTVLLAVNAIVTVGDLVMLTGISLGSFLLAAFTFGRLGHTFGLRRRAWVLTSTAYQILILTIAAILVSPHGPSETQIKGKHEWVILFLFAHMSGVQVASARQSSCQELPTAPMTSSYVDLMSDKYLFVGFKHPKSGPRNRRLAYILAMIIGAVLGTVIHKYGGSWEVVVGTAGLKMIAFGLVCRGKAEEGVLPKVK